MGKRVQVVFHLRWFGLYCDISLQDAKEYLLALCQMRQGT